MIIITGLIGIVGFAALIYAIEQDARVDNERD
jgi:hypothetical protein